jgi:DNA polymerase elongation subunit (family B)
MKKPVFNNDDFSDAVIENLSDEELIALEREVDASVKHYSFIYWVAYNFRDVSGLVDLDQKFKFIQLVNQMAHDNSVLFGDILGTVRYVETGITNRAHNVHNLIVPDKRMMTDGEKVEGALVLNPHIGMHEWVGSVDINSLYPSVIRALNISPEKFIGQFMEGETDWRGIMINCDDQLHCLRFDDGENFEATGSQWRALFKEKKWSISAYGTVFDQSNGLGLVADTLAFWFAERKRLQAEKKKWVKKAKELRATSGITLEPETLQAIKQCQSEWIHK